MKLYPGVFLKSGVMFEYNIMNDGITAVEIGVMLDAYTKNPNYGICKNKQVFLILRNLYAWT